MMLWYILGVQIQTFKSMHYYVCLYCKVFLFVLSILMKVRLPCSQQQVMISNMQNVLHMTKRRSIPCTCVYWCQHVCVLKNKFCFVRELLTAMCSHKLFLFTIRVWTGTIMFASSMTERILYYWSVYATLCTHKQYTNHDYVYLSYV